MASPRTYRATGSSYLILCGLFGIPALLVGAILLRGMELEPTFIAGALAFPAFWAAWLWAFRLRFDATGFSYRSLFRGTRWIPYTDVKGIASSNRAPASGASIGIRVALVDGSSVVLNMKPFSRSAMDAVLALPQLGSNPSLERP